MQLILRQCSLSVVLRFDMPDSEEAPSEDDVVVELKKNL
jgi:hypothetical protein